MRFIAAFIAAFCYVVFAQNLVLTGGYGISESIRTAARPRQLFIFSMAIIYFSTLTSLICRVVMLIPIFKTATVITNLLVYTLVLTAIYLITMGIMKALLSKSSWTQAEKEKLYRQTAISAFNTIVLAVPFMNQKVAYTVSESLAQGIGAGVAFVIATFIIHMGMLKIESNPAIPGCFKGTPALFMYIAILSLAFTGISGESLFF